MEASPQKKREIERKIQTTHTHPHNHISLSLLKPQGWITLRFVTYFAQNFYFSAHEDGGSKGSALQDCRTTELGQDTSLLPTNFICAPRLSLSGLRLSPFAFERRGFPGTGRAARLPSQQFTGISSALIFITRRPNDSVSWLDHCQFRETCFCTRFG